MSMWGALKTWVLEFAGHPGQGKNSPDAMSPLVQSWQSRLELVRALYGGFWSLYAMRAEYLPRHPKEDPQDYDIRSKRPTFYNAFGRTVRSLAGIAFREPPTPEGVPPEIIKLYDDDIDNQGTDGPTFCKDMFEEGLVTGLVGIFVNQQSLAGEGLTRADELAADIRPYWELVRMDDIVSFRVVKEAGKKLLGQLVICDTREVQDGEYGVKVIEQLRAYRRVPPQAAGDSGDSLPAAVIETVYEKGERGAYVAMSSRQLPDVEEIPLAVIYTDRVAFMDAVPPLIDLATVNLLHYQMSSDLHHAAHLANVPMLFGVGIDEETLEIGPNRAILAKGGDASTTLRWLETTGASLGSTRAILSDLEEQMANLGLGMLQRKSRAAQTAEKATIDKQEQDSTLAGIVGDLEDGLERALYYTSLYLGLKTWGRLTFSKQFSTEPTGAAPTEGQGAPTPPKEPTPPGVTNNPKTSA